MLTEGDRNKRLSAVAGAPLDTCVFAGRQARAKDAGNVLVIHVHNFDPCTRSPPSLQVAQVSARGG